MNLPCVKPGDSRTSAAFSGMTCVENVLMRAKGYIAWKWPSVKTMWQRSPGGGGASGGMVAHDLVKAAEKVLLIA